MDAELKAKWVAALRDGSYRQGGGYLQSKCDGKYCCLGVLCDLADPAGWSRDEDNWPVHHNRVGMPTTEFLNSVNLPSADALLLAGMNDDGQSFKAIAAYIEGSSI